MPIQEAMMKLFRQRMADCLGFKYWDTAPVAPPRIVVVDRPYSQGEHRKKALRWNATPAQAVGLRWRWMRGVSPWITSPAHITETNRIHLVLFGIQNRTLGSYLDERSPPWITVSHRLHPSLKQ
jgi:hypothetical protein